MTVDDFLIDALNRAYERFPDCGFLVYVVEDEKGGEVTMLTNMDREEISEVNRVATEDEGPMTEVDANVRLH